jgi:hypothetical protein
LNARPKYNNKINDFQNTNITANKDMMMLHADEGILDQPVYENNVVDTIRILLLFRLEDVKKTFSDFLEKF